jgi:hypothetical protein
MQSALRALAGEHLGNISLGSGGSGRVARRSKNPALPDLSCRFIPPLTRLFGLDKAELEPAEKTCGAVLPRVFPREVSGLPSSTVVLGPVQAASKRGLGPGPIRRQPEYVRCRARGVLDLQLAARSPRSSRV